MRIKSYLFIIILFMILFIPSSVFAAMSYGKCKDNNRYKGLIWTGYDVTHNGVADTVSIDGENSTSVNIVGYFDENYSDGEVTVVTHRGEVTFDTSDITGISLYFEDDPGTQYGSKARYGHNAIEWPWADKYIVCSGELNIIPGVSTSPIRDKGRSEKEDILSHYTCDDLKTSDLYTVVLQPSYKFIRISAVSAMVLLISFDFASAMIAEDTDKMKKAQNRAVKRIVIGLVLFLLPAFLNAVLELLDNFSTCGIR